MTIAYCPCGKRLVKQYVDLGRCAGCHRKDLSNEADHGNNIVMPSRTIATPIVEQLFTNSALCHELSVRTTRFTWWPTITSHPNDVVVDAYQVWKEKPLSTDCISDLQIAVSDHIPNRVVDIEFHRGQITYLLTNGGIYRTTISYAREYDEVQVDGRSVYMGEIKHETRLYNEYPGLVGFMNVEVPFTKSGYATRAFHNKLLIENNIEPEMGEYYKVYYDIETITLPGRDFRDKSSLRIAMISYMVVKPDGDRELHLMMLDRYHYDHNLMMSYLDVSCSVQIDCFNDDRLMAFEFLRRLANMDRVTFVLGFNASSLYTNKPFCKTIEVGFDLPIIISRSSMDLRVSMRHGKVNGRPFVQISRIEEMKRCYFLDMQMIVLECMKPQTKTQMENFKLDTYLSVYGINQKIGMDYRVMNSMFLDGQQDMSKVMAYSVYDSYALWHLDMKSGAIDRILTRNQLLGSMLSDGLYGTQASNITFSLLKRYINAGFMCCYTNQQVKHGFQGAFTYNNADCQMRVLENCMSLDFTSQYPSCIIKYNLSPECFIEETDHPTEDESTHCLAIDDTVVNKPDLHYIFSKDDGLLTKYIREVLAMKVHHKRAGGLAKQAGRLDDIRKHEIMEYTYKIIINSMYGIMGSASNPLFQPQCAIGCTTMARYFTKRTFDMYVEQYRVNPIMCDTDSIYACFPSVEEGKAFGQRCSQAFGEHMDLAFEDAYDKYLISKGRKAYMYLKDDTVCIKGLQWSLYSGYMKTEYIELVRRVLTTSDIKGSIALFYRRHKARLDIAIDTHDVDTLVQYARVYKSTSKTIEDMIRKYTVDLDIIPVVEFRAQSKHEKIAQRRIPVCCLQHDDWPRLSREKIMMQVMAGITKLIGKYNDRDDRDDSISYRMEIYNNGYVTNMRDQSADEASFVEMITSVETRGVKHGVSYHEMFSRAQVYKFVQDIDHSNHAELYTVINETKHLISMDIPNDFTIRAWITQNKMCNGSFHVMYNVACNIDYMRIISAYVAIKHPNVDLGIYRDNGSLRCLYTGKINLTRKTYDNASVHVPFDDDNVDIRNYIAQIITPDVYTINNVIRYSTQRPIGTACHDTSRLMADVHRILAEQGYSFTNVVFRDGFYNIVMNGAYNCLICNKQHDKENPYFFRVGNKLRLKCRRATDTGSFVDFEVSPDVIPSTTEKLLSYARLTYDDDHYSDISSKYVDFDIESRVTMIESAMGTGKTYTLSRLVNSDAYGTVLVLSFRRSFTQAMCAAYGCISYMSCTSKAIRLSDVKRLFIQIDSLNRLVVDTSIDLLVVDEFVSNMLQLTSTQINNQHTTFAVYSRLFTDARKVVVMDGLLERPMANIICGLVGCTQDEINYVRNTHRVFSGVSLPVTIGNACGMMMQIVEGAQLCGKCAIFCTGSNSAITIAEMLRTAHRRVALIHGRDLHVCNQVDGKDVSMRYFKDYWYPQINSIFDEYDILVYTSSITAGISIESPIDKVFCLYMRKTCTVVDFTQGMYRCRAAGSIELYYQPGSDLFSSEVTPCRVLEGLVSHGCELNNAHRDIECYTKSLHNQLNTERDVILFKYLVNVYGFQIDDITVVDKTVKLGDYKIDYMCLWGDLSRPTEEDMRFYTEKLDNDKECTLDDNDNVAEAIYIKALVDVLTTYEITPEIRVKLLEQGVSGMQLFKDRWSWQSYKSKMKKYGYSSIDEFDEIKHNEAIQQLVALTLLKDKSTVNTYDTGRFDVLESDKRIMGYLSRLQAGIPAEGMTGEDICGLLGLPFVAKRGIHDINKELKNKLGWYLEPTRRKVGGVAVRYYKLENVNPEI